MILHIFSPIRIQSIFMEFFGILFESLEIQFMMRRYTLIPRHSLSPFFLSSINTFIFIMVSYDTFSAFLCCSNIGAYQFLFPILFLLNRFLMKILNLFHRYGRWSIVFIIQLFWFRLACFLGILLSWEIVGVNDDLLIWITLIFYNYLFISLITR